jgi:Putative transposase/Transposase zinc-binding domain
MSRPPLEVADIIHQYWEAYLARYGRVTSGAQLRVLQALSQCRTAALGGHKRLCDHCGHTEIQYNSCGNRHCPKCQSRAQAAWLAARERELLPTPYCHVVFTVPEPLRPMALHNPQVLYGLLLCTAADTLQTIARDPKHLGAEIGFLAVLHTWGQQLHHHPHVHCLVPAGGLARDGSAWVACRSRFFLPVKVLSRVFRRTFLHALDQLGAQGTLRLVGRCHTLQEPRRWRRWVAELRRMEWVVYAKKPLAGPQQVLRYLARYTYRVAITNRRLLTLEEGKITFRWRDSRHGSRQRIMALDAVEFLRRFLLHALPHGFQRVRHYGFLANGVRQEKLVRCRQLLARSSVSCPAVTTLPPQADTVPDPSRHPEVCPVCQVGRMWVNETWIARHKGWEMTADGPRLDTS